MSTPVINQNQVGQGPEVVILPTLFGVGYHNYDARPNNFVFSMLAHIVAALVLLFGGQFLWNNRVQIQQKLVDVGNVGEIVLPPSATVAGGGGGGGDMSKIAANKGLPPKMDMNRITPPAAVIKNDKPLLPVPQAVAAMIKIPTSQTQIGDPLSKAIVLSNGTGVSSGVGSGNNGGLGSGSGVGLGPGSGGNTGGGVYRVGGGVSAPVLVYKTEPEFSEEARKTKTQGLVTIACVVGPDGRVRDMQVVGPLGMGLDEKAIEALKQWRFDPAKKDGVPVAVKVAIEVDFHLY